MRERVGTRASLHVMAVTRLERETTCRHSCVTARDGGVPVAGQQMWADGAKGRVVMAAVRKACSTADLGAVSGPSSRTLDVGA